jgi:hypothetical protein
MEEEQAVVQASFLEKLMDHWGWQFLLFVLILVVGALVKAWMTRPKPHPAPTDTRTLGERPPVEVLSDPVANLAVLYVVVPEGRQQAMLKVISANDRVMYHKGVSTGVQSLDTHKYKAGKYDVALIIDKEVVGRAAFTVVRRSPFDAQLERLKKPTTT